MSTPRLGNRARLHARRHAIHDIDVSFQPVDTEDGANRAPKLAPA
jgi:hypothetical protein